MDEIIKDLLLDWKLEKCIEKFEETGIDEESLNEMDDDILGHLFKIVDEEILREMNDNILGNLFKSEGCGFKQKFMKRLEEWKGDPLLYHPPDIELIVDEPNSPPCSQSTIVTDMVKSVIQKMDSHTTDLVNINDVKVISCKSATKQPALELLSSTTRGQIALAAFRLEQELNTRLISHVIIENEFEITACHSITKERFLELANELGFIFATAERDKDKTSQLFYSPFIKATKSEKCVNTGGALYDKYLNLRKKLNKYLIISKIISSPDAATKQSVLELLSSTTRGQIALAAFTLEQELNTRLISDVLIENEFETTECQSITKERFLELANELGVIFATAERDKDKTSQLFYSPFIKATQTKKCVNTGGALYDKYLSLRRTLIKYHIISSKIISSPADTPLSEHHQDIEWLRNNDEPENDVIQKWKNTSQCRDLCRDIRTYFTFYKCLRSPYGHVLLAIDFALIYPEESNNFISKWPTVASKIITYAKEKDKVTLYENQLIDAGKKDIAALFCLANLLGFIIRKRKSSESSEAIFGNSVQDVRNSVILNVKSHEDLEQYKAHRKSLSTDKSRNVGPFVAVIGDINTVGNSEDRETKVFLVINELHFEIPSRNVIQAVDYCYKSFFALNTDFPSECRHYWCFMQLYVYRNSVENTRYYTTVSKVIDKLNRIN